MMIDTDETADRSCIFGYLTSLQYYSLGVSNPEDCGYLISSSIISHSSDMSTEGSERPDLPVRKYVKPLCMNRK